MPHRRIHIVAGKRQAVLKALSDMYNLETPKGPLNPGPELALTRAGRGGQFLEKQSPGGKRQGVGPWLAAGVHWGGSSRRPHGGLPACLGGLS